MFRALTYFWRTWILISSREHYSKATGLSIFDDFFFVMINRSCECLFYCSSQNTNTSLSHVFQHAPYTAHAQPCMLSNGGTSQTVII